MHILHRRFQTVATGYGNCSVRHKSKRFGFNSRNSTIQNNKKVIQLNTVHRQQGDEKFAKILDKIATTKLNQKNYTVLASRDCNKLSAAEVQNFTENAIYVCAKRPMVKRRNEDHLRATGNPVTNIPSTNVPDIQCSDNEDFAEGLPTTLKLSIGTKVMLTHNVCVEKGLANGSTGSITGIVYGEQCIEIPAYILIKIDDYKGTNFYEDSIPILPRTVTWRYRGILCKRTQFPIVVAKAITVHKSQGLTLTKMIVDIGDKEFTCGLTYVALSRVKKLEDLMFLPLYPFKRFIGFQNYKQFINRQHMLQTLSAKSVVF